MIRTRISQRPLRSRAGKKMPVAAIVAVSINGVIGNRGDIPWMGKLPADMKWFRERTKGSTVIMGRKTFESIGKPLPGRLNVVVSHSHATSVLVSGGGLGYVQSSSLEKAIRFYNTPDKLTFVIGGSQIYRSALELDLIDYLYVTEIHHEFEGDAFFPALNDSWVELLSMRHEPDADNLYPYTFKVFQKIRG